ncbi:MAG: hypothetical protein D6820_11385 [Lentisphaerae bacterium]|nr:MAG: hypothetical protein D6820_11385 [Lentisphaerota bacterium]
MLRRRQAAFPPLRLKNRNSPAQDRDKPVSFSTCLLCLLVCAGDRDEHPQRKPVFQWIVLFFTATMKSQLAPSTCQSWDAI